MASTQGIDNGIYRSKGHLWWDDQYNAATLRYFINPVRFAYFMGILGKRRITDYSSRRVLDVGCGGGFLSEEFAKTGFQVSGVDPAPESLDCARGHALESGLTIDYQAGAGEAIPYPDERFDIVLCCDVLEHVDDIALVLKEIGRVLKPGGLFFYDTVNRTAVSYFAVIKLMQEWSWTAVHEPHVHEWRKFVTPSELRAAMASVNLNCQENRGVSIKANMFSAILNLHRCAMGRLTYKELGERLSFFVSDDLRASYMGYAVKQEENAS